MGQLFDIIQGRKTLVLDLDETLVHSSFKKVPNYHTTFKLTVNEEDIQIFLMVRPGFKEFLKYVSDMFEVVVYTASMKQYANYLLDNLDPHGFISYRLYREHCTFHTNCYVKDLRKLGRNLKDNSALSYQFQPENGVPIKDFFFDQNDRELYKILPFLRLLENMYDVRHTQKWFKKFKTKKKFQYTDKNKILRTFQKSAGDKDKQEENALVEQDIQIMVENEKLQNNPQIKNLNEKEPQIVVKCINQETPQITSPRPQKEIQQKHTVIFFDNDNTNNQQQNVIYFDNDKKPSLDTTNEEKYIKISQEEKDVEVQIPFTQSEGTSFLTQLDINQEI